MAQHFIVIYDDVLKDKNITNLQKLLFGELLSLANANGYAHPSNKYLAEKYGASLRTIEDGVKNLEVNGYIKRQTEQVGMKRIRKIYISIKPIKSEPQLSVAGNHGNRQKEPRSDVAGNHGNEGYNNQAINNQLIIPPTPKGENEGENHSLISKQIDSEIQTEPKGSEATPLATREAKEEVTDLNLEMLRYARLVFGKSEIEVPDTSKGMFSGLINRNVDFQSFIDVTNYLATKWTPEFVATKPVIKYLVNMSKWDERENEARSAGFINSKSVVAKQAESQEVQIKRNQEHELQRLANERYPIIKRLYIEKYGREKIPLPTFHMPAFDNLAAWEKLSNGDEMALKHLHEIVEAGD
ncbi:helix-turn-helix domain-containing protein [Leuconostoc mesenteroides]|uniref:helix-turn-helix domain-containing protein n=1 Tax=Leuconostoc mesenteroides TaxID=1245 RepID=UPI001CBF8B83|nr:helix-turn-helix domain-containing protein [Leuconostoc mesenteroides]MBZ1518779.1 helix-turn-helix domain-containing protein [Leuconostoc mesenteroides]MBZ1520974.1 helix-turn-helix domain-containing protein [Leuconostoc mesenteroides]MBZ1522968.1 helix-turn-helix domain-containing protein [Leuconostoc mesenteroides]